MSASRCRTPRNTDRPGEPPLRRALRRTAAALAPASGPLARHYAETILTALTGLPHHRLYLDAAHALGAGQRARLRAIVARCRRGEPLPYVLGTAYFHSVDLRIGPGALIPRPDTEVLVEEVLRREQGATRVFLDMGTGSGAIAAAILAARPGWRALASDLSLPALRIARANLPSGCLCACADRLEGITGPLDFVVCNPPYVTRREFTRLPRSVRGFEPVIALDGGEDGLDFYRYLAAHCGARLRSDGALYLEIGWKQARQVTGLLTRAGWRRVQMRRDLAGRPRVVSARRAP